MQIDIIFLALLSAFSILLITKLGLRDKAIERSPKLISEMFNCDFCLSFWTNMLIALFLTIATGDLSTLAMPIFAAPLTRLMV